MMYLNNFKFKNDDILQTPEAKLYGHPVLYQFTQLVDSDSSSPGVVYIFYGTKVEEQLWHVYINVLFFYTRY